MKWISVDGIEIGHFCVSGEISNGFGKDSQVIRRRNKDMNTSQFLLALQHFSEVTTRVFITEQDCISKVHGEDV